MQKFLVASGTKKRDSAEKNNILETIEIKAKAQ